MYQVYPATHGTGSVLLHFVVSTVAQTGQPAAAVTARLGEAGSTLFASTLLKDAALAGIDAADDLRAHVIGYIRAHLSDPQLSRSSVAAAHHMSVRTLDRLFADEESSVSALIRQERLEASHRDLENPLLRNRSVAAIAAQWCFFDSAHFSRAFRQHYGYPPSRVRVLRDGSL
jgi:AraC-like DNA-binding protein